MRVVGIEENILTPAAAAAGVERHKPELHGEIRQEPEAGRVGPQSRS